MDFVPVSGLDALAAHLDALLADNPGGGPPPLDAALFDEVALQLTDASVPAVAPRLLPSVAALLKRPDLTTTTTEADAVAALAAKLLAPVAFAEALALATEASLVEALGGAAAPATNLLAMAVVHKARQGPGGHRAGPGQLADHPALLAALVVRWLAAPSVAVGEKGGRVLGDLLEADCPGRPQQVNGVADGDHEATAPDGGLWQALFGDGGLDLLQALVRGTHPDLCQDNDHRQASLAQGRVLRLLPRLAALRPTAVEPVVPLVVDAVDRSDALMQRSLADFYAALVCALGSAAQPSTRASLADVLRRLLRAAAADDPLLVPQLQRLPAQMAAPAEAEALQTWLREVLPTRVPVSTQVVPSTQVLPRR